MEGVVEDHDGGPAGRRARDLDGVLDRLGAGVDEERLLLLAGAGRQLGEPAADLDVRLVDADHEALVEVLVGLRLDRLDDGREAVAGVLAADAAGEVDEAAAVDVGDAGAVGVRDDELRGGDAGAHVAGALGEDLVVRGGLGGVHPGSMPQFPVDFTVPASHCERAKRNSPLFAHFARDDGAVVRTAAPRRVCHDCTVSPTVLIVDDHPSFRASARAILEADGFNVVGEAEDGAGGLRMLRDLRPDVVLLDVQLPDMTGFDVCVECGDLDTTSVVLVSSRDATDYGHLIESSGATGLRAEGGALRRRPLGPAPLSHGR